MPGLFSRLGKHTGIECAVAGRREIVSVEGLSKNTASGGIWWGGRGADHTGAGPADNAPIPLIAVDFAR